MRATITRKLVETRINGYSITIQENGEPAVSALNPVTVYGKVSKGEALKELKKVYPNAEGIAVGKIDSAEVQYEISVEDFVKNAKRLEMIEDEKKENE